MIPAFLKWKFQSEPDTGVGEGAGSVELQKNSLTAFAIFLISSQSRAPRNQPMNTTRMVEETIATRIQRIP